MRSSTTAACRALVMVACLIAIPLAALFGTSLPDLVNRVRQGGEDAPPTSGDSREEAPPFGSAPRAVPGGDVWGDNASVNNQDTPFAVPSAWQGGVVGPPGPDFHQEHPQSVQAPRSDAARGQPNRLPERLPARNPRQEAVLAGYETPHGLRGGQSATWPEDLGRESPGSGGTFDRAGRGVSTAPPGSAPRSEPGVSSLVPLARTAAGRMPAPTAAPIPASFPEEGGAAPTPQASRPTDQFTYIQRRLRQLGATYYLLETWGTEGQYYRFHARMAVGGSANYVRHFEATDTDAVRAMAKVLEQVEAWQAGS